jgi:hypothetical protein
VLCFLCSSGCGSLSFLATATHFTWVVRRTAVFGQGAGRCGFNHRGGDFGNHWRFNHWRGLNDRCWLNDWSRLGSHGFENHGFDNRCWRFFYHGGRCWRFNRCGWLGRPLEGGLFFANFTHLRGGFDSRRFNDGFNHWLRLDDRCRLDSGHFHFWLGFLSRGNFHFRSGWRFDWGSGFDHWRFDHGGLNNRRFDDGGFSGWRFYYWRLGNRRFDSSGFFDSSGSTFSLFVSLGFSRCADDRAGNGSGNGQAGSQFGASWLVVRGFCILAGFFRAFDHVAVGITLTLTTVAAATLATGAAAWTIAFGVVLAIFLLLFSG